MKSTIFNLKYDSPLCKETKISENKYKYEFTIPLLLAYAIEHFSTTVGPLSYPGTEDQIQGDKFRAVSEYQLDSTIDLNLIIHYHGIRDYRLLFPWVKDDSLQIRLGEFYKEAELCFDNGSWLGFMLMCGAVFEGMLYGKININKNFSNLITYAHKVSLIDSKTKNIIDKVRDYRNLVHANRHAEPYVSRIDVMDTRTVLDKLIKKFCEPGRS